MDLYKIQPGDTLTIPTPTNIRRFKDVDVPIPDGYYDIPEECIVKPGDRIAHVNFTRRKPSENPIIGELYPVIHWMEADHKEIGLIKKYSGKIVIRKI